MPDIRPFRSTTRSTTTRSDLRPPSSVLRPPSFLLPVRPGELTTAGVSKDMKIGEQEAIIADLREELHGLRQFVDARPTIYTEVATLTFS